MRWAKQFSNNYDSVSAAKFNTDGSRAVIVFGEGPVMIVPLNAADGSVMNSFKDHSVSGGTINSDGLLIDSAGNIYLAM